MEGFLNEKAFEINEKRAKRGNPLYFLKDLVDYSEMLVDAGHLDEARVVFSEVSEAYLNHVFDVMILFHVYSDFGISDRILALSDKLNGKDSSESLGIIYYKTIDSVDSGNRLDDTNAYEEALGELDKRKSGFVNEKLKIYRRYTSALRKAGRIDEARVLEEKLFNFKNDNVWPLD